MADRSIVPRDELLGSTLTYTQTMAILRADSRIQPLDWRLTFSTRDDGVGLGHGSMVGRTGSQAK